MRHTFRGLVLLASLTLAGSCFADTFRSFALNGTLQSGGTATGSIVVDTTTGFLSAGNVTVSADSNVFTFTYLFMQNATGGSPPTAVYVYFLYITQNTITGTDLDLMIPEPLVNYSGGSLCSLTAPCPANGLSSFTDTFVTGLPHIDYFVTLNATSTPEPASLLFVATGLVAFAGKLRHSAVRGAERL